MALKLLKVIRAEKDTPDDLLRRRVHVEYSVSHSNRKTTLALGMTLVIGESGSLVRMEIEGPEEPTPEAALDKFAEWLERMAEGIRNRGTPDGQIPLYGHDG